MNNGITHTDSWCRVVSMKEQALESLMYTDLHTLIISDTQYNRCPYGIFIRFNQKVYPQGVFKAITYNNDSDI